MIWRKALLLALPGVLLTGASPVVVDAAAAKSAVTEVRTIGKTVQGRSIVAWRLGDPRSSRMVVVLAAMHGFVRGPSRILYNLRDGRPITGADIWVVPQYNRDGVVRRTRQNAHGVDLNRNYPRNWKRLTGTYNSGPSPASEPETKAVMAFLRAVRPAYVVSFHQPLKGVGRAGPKGTAFVRRLHRGLRLPVKSFNCSGVCHGTMTEWFNASFGGVAVTVEYGRGLSRKQATRSGPNGLLRAVGARR
ncbi:MAG: M14 family zinc carboxypeptidase [Marmoricola sp.]